MAGMLSTVYTQKFDALSESTPKSTTASSADPKRNTALTEHLDTNSKASCSTAKRHLARDHELLELPEISSKHAGSSSDAKKKREEIEELKEIGEYCGRERMKRHWTETAGRVWIPDIWGQESLLGDLADCSVLDTSLVPKGLGEARAALVKNCMGANSSGGG